MSKSSCDTCMNYEYDEEYDSYCCVINFDEDEYARMEFDSHYNCPYYRQGDEYTIVRKQN